MITTPSVFETKPGRQRERSKVPARSIFMFLLLALIIIVITLYFWGAHLASQGA